MWGAIGALLRFWVSLVLPGTVLGTQFSLATLFVNVLGSFLLALLALFNLHSQELSPNLSLALSTGLLGAMTTYSTFNAETLKFLQDGHWSLGLLNLLLRVNLCLYAGSAGLLLGQRLSA